MYENNVYVKETGNYGKNIFANRRFRRGETVFVVCGPMIKRGSIYTIPIDFGLWIDPVPVNNPARYLCHSCDPNCGIKNRTRVVAMKKINKGEEITIDYAMIISRYGKEMSEKRRICKCQSKNCRGKLGSYRELPEKLKVKYKGFISDYLTKTSK